MRSKRNLRPILLGFAVAAVGVGVSDALAWLTARSSSGGSSTTRRRGTATRSTRDGRGPANEE
jgi:hypothetical protein